MQSVSRYRVLNIRARCGSINLIFSKVSLLISMADGTFGYVLSSFGIKVKTDERFALFGISGSLLGFGRLV